MFLEDNNEHHILLLYIQPLEQVKREHEFRESSLERVIKSGPAVEDSTTNDQAVEKRRRRGHDRPRTQPRADLIPTIQRLALGRQ